MDVSSGEEVSFQIGSRYFHAWKLMVCSLIKVEFRDQKVS